MYPKILVEGSAVVTVNAAPESPVESIIIPPQHTVKCNPHVQPLKHRLPEFPVRVAPVDGAGNADGNVVICNALHEFNDCEGSISKRFLIFV